MSHTAAIFDNPRLATLWAIVESRRRNSTLIVVTSATNLDATQPVARGLCEASHDAGNRTAYLYLGSGSRLPEANSAAYVDLLLPKGYSQRQAFDSVVGTWRSDYEVIIIDLPEFTESALGAHVARIADGAVIALFSGRRITSYDRDLKALLSQLNTSIIGVVNTSKRETFGDTRPPQTESVRSLSSAIRQR